MMTSFAYGRKQTKESTNPLCPFSLELWGWWMVMSMMMTSFACLWKQTKESTNPLCPFSARHSIPIYSLPSPQRGISLQIAENIWKQNMANKFDRNVFARKFLKTFENNTQTQSNQNSLPFSFFFWRKWWNWYITFLLQSETSLPSSFGFHERIYIFAFWKEV